MEVWEGKVAVITGASAGIGAAIAKDLAKAGLNVIGLARRKDRIEELAAKVPNAPGKIHAVECDVSKVESIQAAFAWIAENFGKVHILINNAGRSKCARALDQSVSHDEYLATININLSGLLVCTREAFKLIETHDEPAYIINVNSVAGHMTPSAFFVDGNVYGATKHAVTNHTELLRLEIAAAGNKRVKVTSLSPGVVKTEFGEAAGYDMTKMTDIEYLESEDISQAVLYLLSTPPHVNISELTIKPVGEKF